MQRMTYPRLYPRMSSALAQSGYLPQAWLACRPGHHAAESRLSALLIALLPQ